MSISSKEFCSPENMQKRNSETTTNENEEMQEYEKRILQCILAEKIIPIDLKYWQFFHLLKPEFISQIHMIELYGKWEKCKGAIIVTKDKNVYNVETCDEDYLSKASDEHNASCIKKIKELCGKNIQTFVHSWIFVLALTEEGELYIYEFTKTRGSYLEQPDIPTFTRIAGLKDKRVVDIACGSFHFLALTSDEKVYAWKDNIYTQGSNENRAIFDGSVRQVKHGLEKKNVIHIACGDRFNMVITDENKLYGWGNNEHGQISTVRSQKQYVYPREITTFSDKIVKMVCGYLHTLALTSKGKIYGWGANYCGQVGVENNRIFSDPIVVNAPKMGKVLNIDAYGRMSVAVGYDRTIYIWGDYFGESIIQPFRTKFSRIFDVFAHSVWRSMSKTLIMHDSACTVRITNNYHNKYMEEILNILKSLEAAFDDPLTSDLIIQVEGRPIYVHKAILKIRCQYFKNIFQHDWIENTQSISDSVYTVSEKFSYIVYKAFLKYLYTGQIDLPLENALELLELADMYCETNLIKDCSQKIMKVITVSNVAFLYNKAVEYNAKELEEFCFQFALRHMIADTLSEDYNKLDMSTQAKCTHRATIQNDVTITSSTFYSQNKNVEKRNSETTTKKEEMQTYEKRISQWVLAEKISSMNLQNWPFFHVLKPEFIAQIHMVIVYNKFSNEAIITTKDKNVYSLDYKAKWHVETRDTYTTLSLRKIKEFCGKNMKTFACISSWHWYFILALKEDGEVYVSTEIYSCISHEEKKYVPLFIRVVALSDKHIVDIGWRKHGFYSDRVMLFALTSDGELYEWEGNFLEESDSEGSDWEENDNQVGEANTAYFNVPWQVTHGLEEKKVVLIVCGLTFNIAVTDENTIYAWGKNKGGQISIDRQQKYYKYPHEIITISDKIVKVVCGSEHTLALTNKGEIYAWGNNCFGQVGGNKNEISGPIVVNVPGMGKVLDIAAYANSSIAVGYDKIIYVWGFFYDEKITIPFPTKFSNIHDIFAHCRWKKMQKSLIVRFTNNFKYVEEGLSTLESLRAVFDDPLTSDFTIQVEGRPIYVHKSILKIRCQYFKNMFQHGWIENIQSISDSMYTVSEKFSYIVYKAFLKYLYSGMIDLPSENALELMELADMYCETNLVKDCSQKIKKVISVSNVIFFYSKAIEYNAKELEEFCFQFALRHMEAVVLSEEFIKLDTSTKDNFTRRAAKKNIFGI